MPRLLVAIVLACCSLLGLFEGAVGWPDAGRAYADDTPEESRRALEHLEAGDLAHALSLSEAGARASSSVGAWKVRGFVLRRAGDLDAALKAYEAAVRVGPQDAIAHNNLAVAYIAKDLWSDAERALRSALALDPLYADARNNLGVVLERTGRLEPAREAYRQATLSDPRHGRAWNNLGVLEAQRGQWESAARALARAAEVDPALEAPILNLGLLAGPGGLDEPGLMRLEELAARPDATRALRARALSARAAQRAQASQLEAAIGLYEQALELTPEDVALLNNVAVLEDRLGRDRDALLHLEQALRLDPQLSVVRNNMGVVHVHRGRLDLAEGTFQEVLRSDPAFHRAHYNLGVVHAARGDVARARASFDRAARLAPHDADVVYNLALLAREMGGGADAERSAYERALALDPSLAEAHLALGTLLADPATPAESRDREQARVHLLRFLELAREGDVAGREQAGQWLRWLDASQSEATAEQPR